MEKLGTLEFCTALNGDNPVQAIAALKRFVQTVRKERAEALRQESQVELSYLDDVDTHESDGDASISSDQPPAKKAKVEAWKLDTKSYNVPFVGTSTYKGSCGTVQKGKWPTGFMEAYLQQSPRATEILGNNNNSLPLVPPHGPLHESLLKRKDSVGKRLSSKLFCLYIQALGEIATCMVPLGLLQKQVEDMTSKNDVETKDSELDRVKLEQNNAVNDSHEQLISKIMKEHVSLLFTILNNESTNSGKQAYDLIEAVVLTLSNLASTSIGAAREIVRGFDGHLKDGVIQRLLPLNFKHKTNKSTSIADKKEAVVNNAKLRVCTAYLTLASVLLESGDAMLVSFAINPGMKETKTKPGFAYIAIRRVLAIHSYYHLIRNTAVVNRTIYYLRLQRFIYSVRLLLASTVEEDENRSVIQVRLSSMVTFLQGDVIENISRNACMNFDEEVDNEVLNSIKFQNRMLIVTILSDIKSSPFLKTLHSSASPESVISSQSHNLVRCIQILLALSSDQVQTRSFILQCLNNTPSLLSSFFRAITIPDIAPSFPCISSYSFISFLIENGPRTWSLSGDSSKVLTSEKVVSQIVPRVMTKNILTKTLQTSSHLLLLQCLKCIGSIMKRLQRLLNDVQVSEEGDNTKQKWTDAVHKRLPDFQVLLSVRSKFDPFRANHKSPIHRAHTIVSVNFCDVLRLYAEIFTKSISSLQFDWTKLLPEDYLEFCSANRSLQTRILSTFESIYKCYDIIGSQAKSLSSSRTFHLFCCIMIHTEDISIYNHSKHLALQTLLNIIAYNGSSENYIHHELSIWIDSMSLDTLPSFCKLLDAMQKVTVQHAVIVSNAWQTYHSSQKMPEVSFSPILTIALAMLASDPFNISCYFSNIICRVTSISLIFNDDPMLLASVIRFTLNGVILNKDKTGKALDQIRVLVQYADLIVRMEDNLIKTAYLLLNNIFGKTNTQSKVAQFLMAKSCDLHMLHDIYNEVMDAPHNVSLIIRQCIHHWKLNNKIEINTDNLDILILKLFPIIANMETDEQLIKSVIHQYTSNSAIAVLLIVASSICAHNRSDHSETNMDWSSRCLTLISSSLKSQLDSIDTKDVLQLTKVTSQLSFVCAMVQFLPRYQLEEILKEMVNLCVALLSMDIKSAIPTVLLVLKTMQGQSAYFSRSIPTESVLLLWRVLKKNKLADPNVVSAVNYLESFLAESLLRSDTCDLHAAQLLVTLREDIEIVSDDLLSKDIDSNDKKVLLCSLLQFDASFLATPILNHLKVRKNIDSGVWDYVLSVAILEFNSQSVPIPDFAIEILLNRLKILMSEKVDGSFGCILEAAESILAHKQLSNQAYIDILQSSSTFFQVSRKCRQNGIPSVMEIQFLNFLRNALSSSDLQMQAQETQTILLNYFCSTLLKVLKSPNIDQVISNKFLSILVDTLKIQSLNAMKSVNPSMINKMMISCLKFGIQSNGNISTNCLVILRLLLRSLSSLDKSGFLPPHKIFAMATSHSNFISVARSNAISSRRELIALLNYCLVLDRKKILPLEWDTVAALFVGYNASLSEDDTLFRHFLFLYESIIGAKGASYCQFNFLWGQAQLSSPQLMSRLDTTTYVSGSDHGAQWEPLIEAFETKRIRQTVTNFPIWEKAFPSQEVIEACITNEFRGEASMRSDSIDIEDHSKSDLYLNDMKCLYETDERYSPAFVMPLILGILESFAHRASIGVENNSQFEPDLDDIKLDPMHQYRESFSKIVYRLFQKGAISLSLSCLSSKCLDMRRLGLSTLFYFIEGLKLKESQDISQWRERPQLEMILDSVQRGLSLERIKKIKHFDSDENTEYKSEDLLPMLPSVSALFLARAVLIISKPADEMYASINRHFLRIQDYHGAYNDCFSLPAFMILFCSTNNDNNQARRERIWGLQLLKDGIIDEYSYKAVARRHVPELLMSSFDGFCCCHDYVNTNGKLTSIFDTECFMILEVLQLCLDNGGLSCYNYFAMRIGLFSWIQTTFDSHAAKSVINLKFFRLLHSALKAAKHFQGEIGDDSIEVALFDTVKLARSVVCTFESKFASNHSDGITQMQFSSITCDILHMIKSIPSNIIGELNDSGTMFQVCRNGGIPISSAFVLFEYVKNHDESLHKLIQALSYFPISFTPISHSSSTNESECILEYFKILTTYIFKADLSRDEDFKDTFMSIMTRIKVLANKSRSIVLCKVDIAEMIISCRRIMVHVGLYDTWLDTLVTLFPSSNEQMDTPMINNDDHETDDIAAKAELIKRIITSELNGTVKV